MRVRSLGWEDALEKELATYSTMWYYYLGILNTTKEVISDAIPQNTPLSSQSSLRTSRPAVGSPM